VIEADAAEAAGVIDRFGRDDSLLLPGGVNQPIERSGIGLRCGLRLRSPTNTRQGRQDKCEYDHSFDFHSASPP